MRFLKRGQVTLFIILIIILALIAMYFMSFLKQYSEDEIRQKAENKLNQFIDQKSLEDYVRYCIKDVSEDGLIYVGQQGGVLYPDQVFDVDPRIEKKSIYLHEEFLPYNISNNVTNRTGINVSYGLITVKLDGSDEHLYVPDYPWKGFLFDNGYQINEEHIFSKLNLPPLCEKDGVNNITRNGSYIFYYGNRDTCRNGFNSTQKQLDKFIEQRALTCSNLSNVVEFLNYYNITLANNISVQTFIASKKVIVETRVPLKIEYEPEKYYVLNKKYVLEIDADLKSLYDVSFELLQKERIYLLNNISHNFYFLKSDSENSYRYKHLEISPPIYPYIFDINKSIDERYTYVIRVSDPNSRIKGEKYYFQFAIENRIPALEYIHDQNVPSSLSYYDIAAREGEDIYLAPQGFDPDDDDSVSYFYEGWKETYDSYFNFSCCSTLGGNIDCYTDSQDCVINVLRNSSEWTTSSQFLNTFREARISTNHSDVGVHEVIIRVKDKSGAEDYQKVRIIVNDRPWVRMHGFNSYSDINQSYVSMEDIFVLSGNQSSSFLSPITSYRWEGPNNHVWADKEIFIPSENEDIKTINTTISIQRFFNLDTYALVHFQVPTVNKFNLSISDAYSTSKDSIDIIAYQCLPHRSDKPPYPYNDVSLRLANLAGYSDVTDDPYDGNHVCCSNSTAHYGNVESKFIPCFNFTSYGVPTMFDITDINPGGLPSNFWEENDIYIRNYERFCDGIRGNICQGDVVANPYGLIAACSDSMTPTQDERCSGPSQAFLSGLIEKTSGNLCVDYDPGETFEYLVRLESGNTLYPDSNIDGICDNNYKFYNSFTGLVCMGACDGNGGCSAPSSICKSPDDDSTYCTVAINPSFSWNVTSGKCCGDFNGC